MRKYGVIIAQYCIITWLISLILFGFELVVSPNEIKFKYRFTIKEAKELLLEIRETHRKKQLTLTK